jgi:pseudouridylate synthase
VIAVHGATPEEASLRLTSAVRRALSDRRPIVALESSVLAQGLPAPANREAARRMLEAVESGGAVPAITAVVRGTPTVGLEPDELERFLDLSSPITKLSARDIPWAVAREIDGATTVAASIALATRAGIPVFATGGIGGVHRAPAFDESADLLELARSPIVVVAAGAKSILDLRATHERLETLGVLVLGYGTSELPGFFTAETGIALEARVDTPAEVARVFRAQRALDRPGALLVVQPPPREHALQRAEVEAAVAAAEAAWRGGSVGGAALTPFLLDAVRQATGGRSLAVNLALLEANARLAAEIAAALASEGRVPRVGFGASDTQGSRR